MGTSFLNMESATNSCKTKEELELKGVCHSFSYCEESHILFLCDSFNWTIERYNVSASGLCQSEVVELDQLLSNPTSVYVSSKMGTIFVGCDSDEGVYAFDQNFQLLKRFAQNTKMSFDCIAVNDEVIDQSEVYMSSVNSDKLTKWDYNTGSLLNELSVTTPRCITLKDDKLYFICKVDSIDCVQVFNKHSMEILSKISVSGLSLLGGLCIDESCNVITSACRVVSGSQRRSIFTIDGEGVVVREVLLDFDEDTLVLDMVGVENDIIMLVYEPGPEFRVKIVEFK